MIKSILLVRKLKDTHLDVKHDGDFAFWNMEADVNFMAYIRARNHISKYPIIEKLLGISGIIEL
jgi:hypothetical protein